MVYTRYSSSRAPLIPPPPIKQTLPRISISVRLPVDELDETSSRSINSIFSKYAAAHVHSSSPPHRGASRHGQTLKCPPSKPSTALLGTAQDSNHTDQGLRCPKESIPFSFHASGSNGSAQTLLNRLESLAAEEELDVLAIRKQKEFAIHMEEILHDSQSSVNSQPDAGFPFSEQSHGVNSAHRHHRPSRFPLALPSKNLIGPALPPHLEFVLQGVYFTDGGSKAKKGSWCYLFRSSTGLLKIRSSVLVDGSNNLAEGTAILHALLDAKKQNLKRILIASDSDLWVNFLQGKNSMDQPRLMDIASQIVSAISHFEEVFSVHVLAHAGFCIENDVVDAICTWTLSSNKNLSLKLSPSLSNLRAAMNSCNNLRPGRAAETASNSRLLCACCLKSNSHHQDNCPIIKFCNEFESRQLHPPCGFCLSKEHLAAKCPFHCHKRRPERSALIPLPPTDLSLLGPIQDILNIDFDTIKFPRHQNGDQLLDYWVTIFTHMLQSEDEASAEKARSAALAWSTHYGVSNHTIFYRKRPTVIQDGQNKHPDVDDPEIELARRAMRAASLGPAARVADISKALRKGDRIIFNSDTLSQLRMLYPQAASDESVTFDPCPVKGFAVCRHAVARHVMSRSPNSHPGGTGITFSLLQFFCSKTYKLEDPNSPDIRWTIFCDLIAKIMSGNAHSLSKMFHDVVGIVFDKNFEKSNSEVALRNIGIEESLVRVASALVFEEVIHQAIAGGFLSSWDLGCSRKNGAEIFGRVAATCAQMGCVVSVFDCVKAFNNLRRKDIKDAVHNFNNPLLTALVHFLFGRAHIVRFTDGHRVECFEQKTGILQGNNLSVFLFCLTICWILKPFREQHPEALVSSFVDDLLLISKEFGYPALLADFVDVFRSHGLSFDLSGDAKTSVYSAHPLSAPTQCSIAKLGIRCQTRGIAPCKIPTGTDDFISSHVQKQLDKFNLRARSFQALWTAMLKLKPFLKKTHIGIYEGFLNALRLSLLSMPMYTLRTISPSFCRPYTIAVSDRCRALIDLVFPKPIELILNPLDPGSTTTFPPLADISQDIRQLPMSLGGLSLRLPSKIQEIAYAASCGECIPFLTLMADSFNLPFRPQLLCELYSARDTVRGLVKGFECRKPDASIVFERIDVHDHTPLQQTLTALLNAAEIHRISSSLSSCPILLHAFNARVHSSQYHCSWNFNPRARKNFGIGHLPDEIFSRAIQLASLSPITSPRKCECGAILDPVGLHFLHCHHVHFSHLHDTVKYSIVAAIERLLTKDLAPLSLLTEVQVNRFYPLRYPTLPEGPPGFADIVALLHDTSQQSVVIVDVSSALARNASPDLFFSLNDRSREKRLKYHRYDIPAHLFFPVSVGRTNVLSSDAAAFCDFIAKCYPAVPKAADKIRAAIGRAITVGAARTFNLALRRAQLAAFQGRSLAAVKAVSFLEQETCTQDANSMVSAFGASPLPSSKPLSALRRPLWTHAGTAVNKMFSDNPQSGDDSGRRLGR